MPPLRRLAFDGIHRAKPDRQTSCSPKTARGRGRVSGGRRAIVAGLLVAITMLAGIHSAPAQGVVVPADLQAELISKLAAYDRNFRERAGGTVQVVLVVKRKNPSSSLAAATIRSELSQVDRIGGLPHEETTVEYETPAALAALCRSKRVAILYITPGFDDEIEGLRTSLSGVSVLSVSAIPEYVPRGIVLGFEVISGKPKITLNLDQAKQQQVNFKADALNLMKVYR